MTAPEKQIRLIVEIEGLQDRIIQAMEFEKSILNLLSDVKTNRNILELQLVGLKEELQKLTEAHDQVDLDLYEASQEEIR